MPSDDPHRDPHRVILVPDSIADDVRSYARTLEIATDAVGETETDANEPSGDAPADKREIDERRSATTRSETAGTTESDVADPRGGRR